MTLQLGAGRLMRHSLRQLRASGLSVHALDRNPHAPGFAEADGFAAIDIADAKGIASYARSIAAEAILAVNEAGVLGAARASTFIATFT